MRGDVRLHEQCRLGRIDACCDVLCGRAAGVLPKLSRILGDRDRVQVDDAEHGVVAGLQFLPLQQRTNVVADVQAIGGWLHAGKQALALGHS